MGCSERTGPTKVGSCRDSPGSQPVCAARTFRTTQPRAKSGRHHQVDLFLNAPARAERPAGDRTHFPHAGGRGRVSATFRQIRDEWDDNLPPQPGKCPWDEASRAPPRRDSTRSAILVGGEAADPG